MEEIVLAATMTHVPTLLLSEQEGPIKGKRRAAIDGHRKIARRAKALRVTTVIICNTHWVINANTTFKGVFTSSEFPQFIQDLPCAYNSNPEMGNAIARIASDKGVYTFAHHLDSLELEHGTLVPMRFMSREHEMKVVSVAARATAHNHEESRVIGEAIREVVEGADENGLLVASGSLGHKIWANNGTLTITISSEFNQQVDLHVHEMWKNSDHATFLKMLGDYANFCGGEGSMHDTNERMSYSFFGMPNCFTLVATQVPLGISKKGIAHVLVGMTRRCNTERWDGISTPACAKW